LQLLRLYQTISSSALSFQPVPRDWQEAARGHRCRYLPGSQELAAYDGHGQQMSASNHATEVLAWILGVSESEVRWQLRTYGLYYMGKE